MSIQYYFDKRVISVFFMGMASGLPWVMIGSALTLWLKQAGVSRADIGFAGMIYAVYTVNFLWSPMVDQVRPQLPLGVADRRSWVILCQAMIVAACGWLSTLDPAFGAKPVVLVALIIALASATQDIAIDAYRVDSFDQKEAGAISAAAGATTAGWWTGYAGMGYLPLRLSDLGWSWPKLYLLLGGITFALGIIVYCLPNPRYRRKQGRDLIYRDYWQTAANAPAYQQSLLCALLCLPLVVCAWAVLGSVGLPAAVTAHSAYIPALILVELSFIALAIRQLNRLFKQPQTNTTSVVRSPRMTAALAWLLTALLAPLRDFVYRNGVRLAISILAFILLFKLGEAFLGRMSVVFYKEVGYSNTDIATYSKLWTWWLTIIFATLGGIVNAKLGIFRGLLISGITMAATNLMFVWIAQVGPDLNLYRAAVVLDGFTQAWSTVAFVSFISLLCNHAFSATQYALMASLGSMGRALLATMSGQLVDWLDGDWSLFFILTTIMVIPGLAILWTLRQRVTALEGKGAEEEPR